MSTPDQVVVERDRARATAAALEQQLAEIGELHIDIARTDPQDFDLDALWDDLNRVLHPEARP